MNHITRIPSCKSNLYTMTQHYIFLYAKQSLYIERSVDYQEPLQLFKRLKKQLSTAGMC